MLSVDTAALPFQPDQGLCQEPKSWAVKAWSLFCNPCDKVRVKHYCPHHYFWIISKPLLHLLLGPAWQWDEPHNFQCCHLLQPLLFLSTLLCLPYLNTPCLPAGGCVPVFKGAVPSLESSANKACHSWRKSGFKEDMPLEQWVAVLKTAYMQANGIPLSCSLGISLSDPVA